LTQTKVIPPDIYPHQNQSKRVIELFAAHFAGSAQINERVRRQTKQSKVDQRLALDSPRYLQKSHALRNTQWHFHLSMHVCHIHERLATRVSLKCSYARSPRAPEIPTSIKKPHAYVCRGRHLPNPPRFGLYFYFQPPRYKCK
jgi:hypothetical protein